MKILATFVFLYFLYPARQYCQSVFSFEVGGLYRITPVYFHEPEIIFPHNNVYISEDRQLTSGGLSYGLKYHSQGIKISFEILICHRYGYIHGHDLYPPMVGSTEDHSGLMTDFSFRALKEITWKQDDLYFGIGHTVFNRGTNYNWTSVEYLNGQPVYFSGDDNLYFEAFTVVMGYRYQKKLSFELNSYMTNKHNFDSPSALLLFEFRTCFNMPLFKKP